MAAVRTPFRKMLALLVRVDHLQENTSRSLVFGSGPVRIGRNALNDIALPFPFVSQWHAVVAFDATGAAYYDLGSTNGTSIQGQRLPPNQAVGIPGPEYEFRIGALRLTFQLSNVPEHMITGAQGGATSVAAGLLRQEPGHPSLQADMGSTMMIDTAMIDAASMVAARAGAGPQGPSLGAARNQLLALRPLYQAHRRAWAELYQGLHAVLQQTPPGQLAAAVSFFAENFPEATGEAQFRAVAESQQEALPGAGAAEQLVQRLAQYLVPGRPPPASAQEIEGFLVRAMAAMETFATAYVSLRRSQEEFGAEMAGFTKRNADPDPIENPQDPKALLAHLLDWTGDGDARMRSLRRQYAEIMSHQVALLGGLMEGVRKLVQVRLSPKAILEHVERAGGLGFGPFKGAAAWKRYLALHDELTEDKEITSAIFGRDFARAYSAGLGENFGGDDPRRVASGRGH